MNALAYDIIQPTRNWRIHRAATHSSKTKISYWSKPDFVDRFHELLNSWEGEILAMSSVRQMMERASVVEIIEMGDKALPLIFESLRQKPSFLFMAAAKITGENPVPNSAQGKTNDMVEAWLRWAERTGADAD